MAHAVRLLPVGRCLVKKGDTSQLGQEGDEVVLFGLEQNAEFNGAHGVFREWRKAAALGLNPKSKC